MYHTHQSHNLLTTNNQQILSNRLNRSFIILMSLIRERRLTTSRQFEEALSVLSAMPDFPQHWRDIATDLFLVSKEGDELFWLAYDMQATNFPPLQQWRDLVAKPASFYLDDHPLFPHKQPAVVTSFQDMEDLEINWLWESRLPLGMLTILDGDPGLSKSMLTIDLAARVSRGLPMPDGNPGLPTGAGVVIITAEDDPRRTLRPRLLRAGADLSRVFMINKIPVNDPASGYTYHRNFLLPDDLPRLEQAIDQTQAKLIILDPAMVLAGNKDTCRYNDVFMHFSLLHELLEKKQTACILLRHLNKAASHHALYRSLDSIAFIGLVRTELMVVNDPYDEQMSLLVHMKSNIGELAPTLSFSVSSDEAPAVTDPSVSWHGTSPYSSHQALSTHSIEPKLSALRSNILRILQHHAPESFSPLAMAKQLPHIPLNTLYATLRRMANDAQIEQPVRGQYCLTVPPSQDHIDVQAV